MRNGISNAFAVVLLVIIMIVSIVAGFSLSQQFSNERSTVTTTIVTTNSTLQEVRITSIYTSVITTYTNTSTVVAAQSLNMSQGVRVGSFSTVSCLSTCTTPASTTFVFHIPNMNYFYSQINVSAPNVSASVSPHSNDSIALTLANGNRYPVCFVYYLDQLELPPTIYVWYYGNETCP